MLAYALCYTLIALRSVRAQSICHSYSAATHARAKHAATRNKTLVDAQSVEEV